MIQRVQIPARRTQRHYEDAEQQHVIAWAHSKLMPAAHDTEPGTVLGDYLFAVPNGGTRNPREAARMKGTGVKAGVSDLVLALPRGGYHGLYLEMKKRRHHFRGPAEATRAVSREQRTWLDRMSLAGYLARVAYGADEAIALIRQYMHEVPTTPSKARAHFPEDLTQ